MSHAVILELMKAIIDPPYEIQLIALSFARNDRSSTVAVMDKRKVIVLFVVMGFVLLLLLLLVVFQLGKGHGGWLRPVMISSLPPFPIVAY